MKWCAAGHESHETKMVDTDQGEMTIYDYEQYMGFDGYCPGQDDVSRTIDLYGYWEKPITELATKILDEGDRSRCVIDVGAHIGWYTRLAQVLKYKVFSYEGDDDNAALCKLNNPALTLGVVWFGTNTETLLLNQDVELLKIDIEGAEQHAIRAFSNLKIANIIMEVSPCFNDSYPALIESLAEQFEVMTIEGEPFDGNFDFNQTNLWFRRRP